MELMHLRWRELGPAGATCHAARRNYPAGDGFAVHDHDFFEVFWVESGHGWHLRGADGDPEPIAAGHCLMVPLGFAHGFSGGDLGFSIVNVAFPARVGQDLIDRLPHWPWGEKGSDGGHPSFCRLGLKARERLSRWLPELRWDIHPLAVESFLLDLIRSVTSDAAAEDNFPVEVRQALDELILGDRIPLNLDPALLAKRIGWSIDHLNRRLRTATGCSTTDFLNRVRIDHAERLLRLSTAPVTEVALSAGFGNIPHFYRCFRSRYGTAPLRYRRIRQGALG